MDARFEISDSALLVRIIDVNRAILIWPVLRDGALPRVILFLEGLHDRHLIPVAIVLLRSKLVHDIVLRAARSEGDSWQVVSLERPGEVVSLLDRVI